MPTTIPRPLLRIRYEEAAEAYLRSLPLEHFMESTAQATQRKITLESLDLVQARRADVQHFNELLVQYPHGRNEEIHQVVPDNMVVVCTEPIDAKGSYDLVFQPVKPLWVLEYVSPSNKRKDYEDSFHKYEKELKVPYYLLFYPHKQELTLYHLGRRKYVALEPNEHGRLAIPELDLEIGLLDRWVRYWYKGELLPLPAQLQTALDDARRELQQAHGELAETKDALLQTKTTLTETKSELADTKSELADTRSELERERLEKEKLLAKLKSLGIEPQS
jgi:Uma2 family endonuclease